jgi:hypothetical protein
MARISLEAGTLATTGLQRAYNKDGYFHSFQLGCGIPVERKQSIYNYLVVGREKLSCIQWNTWSDDKQKI